MVNTKKLFQIKFAWVAAMHFGNVLMQIFCLAFVFSAEYRELEWYRENLGFLLSLVSSLVVFKINWLDIGILEAFSILNHEKGTESFCRNLKKFMIGLFLATNIPCILLRIATFSRRFSELGKATQIMIYVETSIWLLFGILYENIQSVYLFRMAQTGKIARSEFASQIQRQVRINILMVVIDWFGMILHALTVFWDSQHNELFHAVSIGLVGVHTHLICYIYMGMLVLVRKYAVQIPLGVDDLTSSKIHLEPVIQSIQNSHPINE
jgi:hypothetical protein